MDVDQQMLSFSIATHVGLVSVARCPKSGLLVGAVKTPGPMARAYVTVKTEAADDSGVTHALEHLVFCGSGEGTDPTIDEAAAANGANTNATTECDRTTYLLETVGSSTLQGLLQLYLKHLFHPRLTENDFLTEVYHVDGSGQPGGVVYEEVAPGARDAHAIVWEATAAAAFPRNCCYGKNQGGHPNALESLTLEQVRAAHARMYRPDAAFVLVVSPEDLDPKELLEKLGVQRAEGVSVPTPEPWRLGRRSTRSVFQILLPEDPEETGGAGLAMLLWNGPLWRERTTCTGLKVLLTWLASEDGPLRKALEPLCADVETEVLDQDEAAPGLTCSGVRPGVTSEQIARTVERATAEALAKDSLKQVLPALQRLARRHGVAGLLAAEHSPADWLSAQLSLCFAGRSTTLEDHAQLACREAEDASLVTHWHLEDWVKAASWLTAPFVCVLGVPSKEQAALLERSEARRPGDQASLDAAIAGRRRSVWSAGGPVPQAGAVAEAARTVCSVLSGGSRGTDGARALDTVLMGTSFVGCRLSVELPSSDEPDRVVALLTLWALASLGWEQREGLPSVDWKNVVAKTADAGAPCSWNVGFGVCPSVLSLSMVVPLPHQQDAVEILVRSYRDAAFDRKRLELAAETIKAEADEAKKDGEVLITAAVAEITQEAQAAARSNPFRAAAIVKADGFGDIVKTDLAKLRDRLLAEGSHQIRLGCWAGVKDPLEPWNVATLSLPTTEPTAKLAKHMRIWPEHSVALFACAEPGTPLDGYLRVEAPLPCDFDTDSLAALFVGVAELSKENGPLWSAVRGAGLGYSVSLSVCPARGSILFVVRSTENPAGCFESAAAAVRHMLGEEHASKRSRDKAHERDLAGPKLSVLAWIAADAETPLALLELLDHERLSQSSKPETALQISERVPSVESNEMIAALRAVVLPLFDGGAPRVAAATAPAGYRPKMEGFKTTVMSRGDLVEALSQPRAGAFLRETVTA
jgi:hypothetical protein